MSFWKNVKQILPGAEVVPNLSSSLHLDSLKPSNLDVEFDDDFVRTFSHDEMHERAEELQDRIDDLREDLDSEDNDFENFENTLDQLQERLDQLIAFEFERLKAGETYTEIKADFDSLEADIVTAEKRTA